MTASPFGRSDGDRDSDRGEPPVTVRDRRRVDPQTGELREPASTGEVPVDGGAPAEATADAAEPTAEAQAAAAQLAQLTEQLQRVAAEYANYRRRMDRTVAEEGQRATGAAALALLPVLDDISRAREHGDLTGGFKAVGEAVEQTLVRLGLVKELPVGQPFDPNQHEALLQQDSDEVTEPTVTLVLRAGYSLGDRLLRPAQVQVAVPTSPDGGDGESGEDAEVVATDEPSGQ